MAARKDRARKAGVRSSKTDFSEREQFQLADRRAGRIAISVMVVVLLSAMALSVLPATELRRVSAPFRQPITDVTGLSQNWNLFAPFPRDHTIRLEARLTYPDGSLVVWHPPTFDRFLGAYRSYRWRKWASYVLSADQPALYKPAARYIASINPRRGQLPTQVTLVKQTYQAPPAGSGVPRDHDPDWTDRPYYILNLTREAPRAPAAR